MQFLSKLIVTAFLVGNTQVAMPTQAVAPEAPVLTPHELVLSKAEEYGVSADLMECLINKETMGTWDTDMQSKIIYAFSDPKRGIVKGDREKSFGLAQIHLPDHPKITLEQATSPEFAIDFMAKSISEGDAWMWTTLKFCK